MSLGKPLHIVPKLIHSRLSSLGSGHPTLLTPYMLIEPTQRLKASLA